MNSIKSQRGITLTGVILGGIVMVLLAILAFRIVPDVFDYSALLREVKATAQDASLRNASVAEIRRAFEKRIQIDSVTSITSNDLDISKEGNELVIAFAYTRKYPLFGHVSLLIEFEGNSAGAN